MNQTEFTPSELSLSYPEWEALARKKRKILDPENAAWLHEWNMQDLLAPPATDELRMTLRLGHYTGWMAAKRTRR